MGLEGCSGYPATRVCEFIINNLMFVEEGKVKILNKRVSSLPNYKLVIGEAKEQLKLSLLSECPRSINKLVQRINRREGGKEGLGEGREHWVFGERKVFFWVLIFYSHLHSFSLQDLVPIFLPSRSSILRKSDSSSHKKTDFF